MHHDEHAPERVHPQGDKPLLAARVRVFDGQRHAVVQSILGVGEAHTMLA